MSKTISIILSGLLMVAMITVFVAIIIIEEKYDINLFCIVAGWIAGGWIAEKTIKFYKWLRNDNTQKEKKRKGVIQNPGKPG